VDVSKLSFLVSMIVSLRFSPVPKLSTSFTSSELVSEEDTPARVPNMIGICAFSPSAKKPITTVPSWIPVGVCPIPPCAELVTG
jgi:hypothetical protein